MTRWTYQRCGECDRQHNQVMPNGPVDAKIILIGESPGKREDILRVPFVGLSGQEQDWTYFRLAGIDRSEVFVTNCVQCRCERNGVDVRPGEKLLRECSQNHLREEILTVKPEIIVLAGSTACSLVPRINLEYGHGFPWRASVYGHECWVVPMYHPAAGMRETRYMIPLLEDWEKLGLWMRGKWEPPQSAGKPHYELLSTPTEIYEEMDDKLRGHVEELAVDTESDETRPYSIQFSCHPGSARMFLVKDKRLVEAFACALQHYWGGKIVAHNAPYDLDILDKVGVQVSEHRDTMQEAYHLGNLPQGLKQAIYRIFGHKMTSYDEVVVPFSKLELDGWLALALDHVSETMRTEVREQLKTKVRVTFKPHESEAVIRRIMGKLQDGSDYDPWEPPKYQKGEYKPRLIGREWLEGVEGCVGRMPRKSIVHAPIEKQIQYACSDADWTGRYAYWLEGERKRIMEKEWNV